MRKLILLTAVALLVVVSSKSFAQTSATATGTSAGAVLIKPMTISKTADLHFGSINVLTGVAGTVTLPSNSTTRSFSGGVVASTISPTATNAAFSITGTQNEGYALTIPASITVTETIGSTATMIIDALSVRFANESGDTSSYTSQLSGTGTSGFTLGGTLNVGASQVTGIYAGSFDVTVDYN